MAVEPGRVLLHYRLVEKIGEGGMGVVWKAIDSALDRSVAIKILPDALALDADRLARFEREAKLLASLQHPGIAAAYGLHEAQGVRFLAMEYVPGESLADRIARGRLPADEALGIARQVAEALEAAHESGVVHRDLKPANIQVAADGRVKILDFGLAKALDPETRTVGANASASPTITSLGTVPGVILGTAAYMSPEQARGRPVDRRADVWGFGCVLYELLTGKRAFPGETVTDLLVAVVKEEPDWAALPREARGRIEKLIARCLVKDPHERLRDIGDARLEIQAILARPEEERDDPARPSFALGAALLVGALVASAIWWIATREGPASGGAGPTHLALSAPAGFSPVWVRISPDGRTVAYSAEERPGTRDPGMRLLLRDLGRDETRIVPGSEGVSSFTFSPDGRWIAFIAPISPQSTRFRTSKAPVDGRTPPLALSDADPAWREGVVWLADGDLLVVTTAPPQRLARISAGGGTPRPGAGIAADVGGSISLMSVMPDGTVLVELETWDGGYRVDPAVLDPRSGKVDRLATDGASPTISLTGHVLFSRHGDLLAAAFDVRGRKLRSGPVSIANGLRSDMYSYRSPLGLSTNGTLVHLPGGEFGGKRTLVRVGPEGVQPWSGEARRIPGEGRIAVSADGRWMALTLMNEDGLYEIWGSEVERPSLRRLGSFATMDCANPAWSADAGLLAFTCSGPTERAGVYVTRMGATGEAERILVQAPGEARPAVFSVAQDGTQVLIRQGAGPHTVVAASLEPGTQTQTPRTLLESPGAILGAEYSPDRTKLAYVSQDAGRFEVFVRRCALDGTLGPPVPVTEAVTATWTQVPGGKAALLCTTAENTVVRIGIGDDLAVQRPAVLLDFAKLESQLVSYAVQPDGTLLAALRGEDERPPQTIDVVLGFGSELEARVGR